MLKDLEKFVDNYKELVEYFTNYDFSLVDYLKIDFLNMFLLLRKLEISSDTFLVSNFRNFDPTEGFPYPYIRWLLHSPVSFRNYERHHKLYGSSVKIEQYYRKNKFQKQMEQDSHIWFSMEASNDLDRIVRFAAVQASDIFKLYIKTKYLDELSELKVDLNFLSPEKIPNIEKNFPFVELDKIFNNQKRLYL